MGGNRFSELMGSALGARAYFILLRQKKVAKEKATPGSAPLRVSLRYSAGRAPCQNSPAAQAMREKITCCGRPPKKGKNQNQQNANSARAFFPGPLRGAEQRRSAGGSRRALFEGRSPELRSRALSDAAHREEVLLGCPAFRVAQGTGAAGTDPGVAFSLATFFWPHKKSTPASKAETHANQYSKREQHKEPSKC